MIRFELVTLNGTKHKEEVYQVVVPTPDGYIGVFKDHASLVSLVTPGVISVRQKQNQPDEHMPIYATNGGVVEIMNNEVRVLVDEADAADELNEAEIQEAIEAARRLKSEAKDQVSLDKAQQLIDRAAVRLKVADLRRRRKRPV